MTKRDGRKRRGLSQDERVLWSTVTRSISPLRDIPAEPDIEAEPAIAETQRRNARKPKAIEAPVLASKPASKPVPPPSLTPLSRRMRRSVTGGRQDIDARLDLHGLTQAQAHSALLRFLHDASAREARLVLVITGKGAKNFGARSEGGGERGVLKRQVPHWLALPEFRALVIGFEEAGVRHGGEGALYVRLRRTRD
jgi:DNA-nicking Smr family endonuclease